MKKLLCVLIILVSILLGFIVGNSVKKEYKYAITSADGMKILYDKENGLSWRNVRCEGSNVPTCWELMGYYGAVVPDGEEEIRHRNFKEIAQRNGIN